MANGIYMGGVGMGGEASVDIRNLAEEIEASEKAFGDAAAKRKPWQLFGEVISKFFPGWGHAAKLGIDTIVQDQIKMPDTDLTETIWTGGEAGKYEEAFADAKEGADPSFTESLLSELISFGGSEVGEDLIGDFSKKTGDWFKNLFKGDKSIAREGGYVPKKYYGGGSVPKYQEGGETFADKITMDKFKDYNLKKGRWETGSWRDALGPGGVGQSSYDIDADRQVNILDLVNLVSQMMGSDDPSRDPIHYDEIKESFELPKKYYGGGSVKDGVPTISDYFNMQGKSLGGSNKQSLAEMLGRK